jgi:thiol-disulfide isomerase/thioredoxin
MKNFTSIVLVFLPHLLFAQNNFKIEFSAPTFENDSLYISPLMNAGYSPKLYAFEAVSNKNTLFKEDFQTILIRVQPKNLVEGRILYPQPISFSHYDSKNNEGHSSRLFFLEKGNFKFSIDRNIRNMAFDYTLISGSPANTEYKTLKNKLKVFDEKLEILKDNDSKYFDSKQKYLQKYINKHPNSYVAFWEIVNDYSSFGFNKSYFKSLTLFSPNVKKTHSYLEFKKILEIDSSTNVGEKFPDVSFSSNEKIVKSDFSNYKVTLIDYWATWCIPCIRDLPNLVELYEKYKNKGVNFISVTDENKKEKIDLATKILEDNKVGWKNYFDVNKEFHKSLNISGYPTQILVDSNGKIIARKEGDLDKIEAVIKKSIE